MKFSPKAFLVIAVGLSATITAALESGLVPAEYASFAAGLSTLLGFLAQKKSAA